MRFKPLKNPTIRKALNRGYKPVRFWNSTGGWYVGYVFETKPRGGVRVYTITDRRIRKFSAQQAAELVPLA